MKTPDFPAAIPVIPPVGAGSAPGVAPASESPGPQAVSQARREIQDLTQEIAALARSDIEPQQFYEELTKRAVLALAALGGAVWVRRGERDVQLAFQTNAPEEICGDSLTAVQHRRLLVELLGQGNDALVPARSSGIDASKGNPTECLLVVGLMSNDSGPQALLEVFQRADTRATAQRGYLRFVRQLCELAGNFLRSHRLRQFVDRQSLWEQLSVFTHAVHADLDVTNTAFRIANEGRRLAGCDRLSVAVASGSRMRIEAISGQESFDARSNMAARLARLAAAASRTGEPLWYSGDDEPLPPQIETALNEFLDLAHARTVAVLPLHRQNEDRQRSKPELIGALIFEQIEARGAHESFRERASVVRQHSEVALANALEHKSVFLLPLWKAIGRLPALLAWRTLPKTLAVFIGIALVIATLVLAPADFQLEANGTLQPQTRRDVFAAIDGVVVDVPARHGQTVRRNQLLAEMRNTELDIRIADLVGRRDATLKQIRSIERALLGAARGTAEEQNRLSGQVLQLRKTYESLERQLELSQQNRQSLRVTSPIDGQVITWQVEQRLNRRPVRQGQVLLTVADPQGPWELWIDMPEDRMGAIATAAQASEQPLPVTFFLATDPGRELHGEVVEIHASAEVREDGQNSVRLRVAIDKTQLEQLRPGASVTAKVDCGTRSLGYVWLHDLFRFVEAKILFRL
ncbi:MAG: efflux RND transporter periplasmic adaptor subunit [Planctomycetales bacterium]|nr:efflux RND transporter periplasmic adaptor subunit [Planctomycetales bacterium]